VKFKKLSAKNELGMGSNNGSHGIPRYQISRY